MIQSQPVERLHSRGHVRLHVDELQTPLGAMTLVAYGSSVIFLQFGALQLHRSSIRRLCGDSVELNKDKLHKASKSILRYFDGDIHALQGISTVLHGTSFQRDVWTKLTTIPYGKTWSYGQLAEAIGRPKAVRAVGMANKNNRITLIVPCHRVIGSDGSLTGYASGVKRKEWLLRHEKALH